MPSKTDPRAPFRRIADDLREEIRSKRLKPGDLLPKERELRERYGTSHSTIRQGLGLLKGEGLIDSVQGLGYFVREPFPVFQSRNGVVHFVIQAKEQGHTAEQRLQDVTAPMQAPEHVAALLALSEDELVIVRRYLILLDNQPAQLAESYFPYKLVKDTRIARYTEIRGGPLAELQMALSLTIVGFTEDLSVRMPNPQEQEGLRLPSGTPVINVVRTTFATGGTLGDPEHPGQGNHPVEVTEFLLAGHKHRLSYGMSMQKEWSPERQEWVQRQA